jgi:hypothetical protein
VLARTGLVDPVAAFGGGSLAMGAVLVVAAMRSVSEVVVYR